MSLHSCAGSAVRVYQGSGYVDVGTTECPQPLRGLLKKALVAGECEKLLWKARTR